MRRAGWLPFLFGLVAGGLGGTTYAWKIDPVAYVDTAPASLRSDFQAIYLTLIASAYAGNPDLARAQARLALFPDPNPADTLAALAQQLLAAGVPASEARVLAQLASDLGERPGAPATRGFTPAPAVSPSPTRTPTSTSRPPPTRTPTATPGAPYELASREKVCDPDIHQPLIQVVVEDAGGTQVPGVEVLVVWDQGQDHFFTGLKPELGLGYGDFAMQEGVTYTLQLLHSEVPVTRLRVEDCVAEDGSLFSGSWLLEFVQP